MRKRSSGIYHHSNDFIFVIIRLNSLIRTHFNIHIYNFLVISCISPEFPLFFVYLDLRNNSLKNFPLLTKLNETLQILSLRRNQICTIDTSALNFYRNLLTLELDQNPLHCDCRMERNFRQLKISGQCESPPERRNVNLNELPNEPFACSLITTPQCAYLTKTIMNDDERKPTTTATTTRTTITTETTTVMKM